MTDITRGVEETLYACACGWNGKDISSESCKYWKFVFIISPEFTWRH
jgi:hypothetical protein